jgi:regulator of sigma E protease
MVVVSALVLGGMIVIHEFGHFIVAKLFGVRVEVFSIGFGKRLWGTRRGDTDYRLSLFPFGGYVKMAGENLDEQVTGAPDEFMSKPKWQRLCIAFAGPVMNVLTAIAIPMVMAMIHYEMPAYLNKPAVVGAVEPGSAAELAGLQRGDVILKVDGQEHPTFGDFADRVAFSPDQTLPLVIQRGSEIKQVSLSPSASSLDQEKIGNSGVDPVLGPDARLLVDGVASGSPADAAGLKPGDQILEIDGQPVEQNFYGRDSLIRAIQNSAGRQTTLKVKRGADILEIQAAPRMDNSKFRLGFYSRAVDEDVAATRLSLPAAVKYSVSTNLRWLSLTKIALTQVFVGKRSARDTFMGPIQIFKVSGEAAKQGPGSVFLLMSLLSLNLGIFNLLPIPVLDGGLILMILLEAILGLVGLPLTLRTKERMMQVGFVLMLLLGVLVAVNDISKVIPHGAAEHSEQQKPPSNK